MSTVTYTRGTATHKVTTASLAGGEVLLTFAAGEHVTVAQTKTGAELRTVASTEKRAPGAYERQTRTVVHFTDGTSSIAYSSSQTWMTLTDGMPVPFFDAAPAEEAPAEVAAALPTTPEEFTAEVADLLSGVPVVKHRTPKALREVGPMARLDPVAAAKSRPAVGRATVAAVSPAAAKGVTRRKDGAVVLASGLVEGSPEANAAEAAEDARITAMQEEVAANKAEHRARLTANQKAGKARVAAARAAEAVYAEDQPAIVAERAAADATARVRVGLRLAEAVQAATALTLGDSLRGKLAAKAPNGDGVRVVHLTATERAALGQVCNNVEATAREAVAAGDRAAVSLVFSAQATLRQLAAV